MIKKKEIRNKIFNDEIHRISWYIQIGGDEGSAINWFVKKCKTNSNIKTGPGTLYGCFAHGSDRPRDCLIWVSSFSSNLISHEVTHEVTHAVNHVLYNLLFIDMSNNNEFASDYHEWLTGKFINLGHKK